MYMGLRNTSSGALGSAWLTGGSKSYRPESPIKQVGYLLVLAVVCAMIMFAGLGLVDLLLDSAQG
jgi:hypothetical protein